MRRKNPLRRGSSEDALAFVEEEVVILVEGGGGNRIVDRERGWVDGGHATAGDRGGGADEGEGDGEGKRAGEGFHGELRCKGVVVGVAADREF